MIEKAGEGKRVDWWRIWVILMILTLTICVLRIWFSYRDDPAPVLDKPAPVSSCDEKALRSLIDDTRMRAEANKANAIMTLQILNVTARQWGSRVRLPTGLGGWAVVRDGELRIIPLADALQD